jgi:hypothetical protein
MITAAVGLSPKIVVRSDVTTVRGSAEPSSLLLAPLSMRVSLLRSVVVDELELLGAAGLGSLAEPDGALTDPLAEPEGPETEPLAEPDGVETEPLADPLGLLVVCAMAPPNSPKVTRAMSRGTATLFMLAPPMGGEVATAMPPESLARMTRSRR